MKMSAKICLYHGINPIRRSRYCYLYLIPQSFLFITKDNSWWITEMRSEWTKKGAQSLFLHVWTDFLLIVDRVHHVYADVEWTYIFIFHQAVVLPSRENQVYFLKLTILFAVILCAIRVLSYSYLYLSSHL